MNQHSMQQFKLVFYDGECGFCNRIVQFVLNNSNDSNLKFCALQSSTAQQFIQTLGIKKIDFSTFYYWNGNCIYSKSEAFFRLCKELNRPISFLRMFAVLPKNLTDWIYDLIAKNRKKMLENYCVIPSNEQRNRFVN